MIDYNWHSPWLGAWKGTILPGSAQDPPFLPKLHPAHVSTAVPWKGLNSPIRTIILNFVDTWENLVKGQTILAHISILNLLRNQDWKQMPSS